MAPAKRKSRRKDPDSPDPESEMPDSSPAVTSSKRRKVDWHSVVMNADTDPDPSQTNGTQTSPTKRKIPEHVTSIEESDSGPEDATFSGNKDLTELVIACLQAPDHKVTVVSEHANDKIDDAEKVPAYAKIAGRDWTYFVVGQTVNIGRAPDKDPEAHAEGIASPTGDAKEVLEVHIDLGPSKYMSRHHASIFYDADSPQGGGWHLRINGRNGVRVNHHLYKRTDSYQLKSGDVLDIGGTQMMFVTPGDKAVIDPSFIEQAKLAPSGGEEWTASQHAHPAPEPVNKFLPTSPYPSIGHPPLAPAPPSLKRAMTPPSAQRDGRNQRGVFDGRPPQSPMYNNRGIVIESSSDIDYSHEAAKDLKPPYSYATMIAQAIFSNEEEKLTLSHIYAWISDNYAFYRHTNSGWQNSIRHNLSLNKAFQKVPRRTDEPGKGMKWQIAAEFRQDYLNKQAKKGLPSSSAPTSPAAAGTTRDVPSKFKGANGQYLGYDSTYTSQFLVVNTESKPSILTPNRRPRKDTQTTAPDPDLEIPDSPIPLRQSMPSSSTLPPAYTLPPATNQPQLSQESPTRPSTNRMHGSQDPSATLSSSYFLSTPFHSSSTANASAPNTSILTPAPRKMQSVRLAPPSTLVAPSKFMPPDSSPAGAHGSFWRGMMTSSGQGGGSAGYLGSTPFRPIGEESSPVKSGREEDRAMMSSSPPPVEGPGEASPSKRAGSSFGRFGASTSGPTSNIFKTESRSGSADQERVNGVSAQGSANAGIGAYNTNPPLQHPRLQAQQPIKTEPDATQADIDMAGTGSAAGPGGVGQADDDAGMLGGFDLARGFMPIGGGRGAMQQQR